MENTNTPLIEKPKWYLSLYWTPRILSILFVVFISLFALDAFDGERSLGQNILGFLIHLVPSFIAIIMIMIAWKWELIGGVILLLLDLVYLFVMGEQILYKLPIAAPLFLVAALFMIQYFVDKKYQA